MTNAMPSSSRISRAHLPEASQRPVCRTRNKPVSRQRRPGTSCTPVLAAIVRLAEKNGARVHRDLVASACESYWEMIAPRRRKHLSRELASRGLSGGDSDCESLCGWLCEAHQNQTRPDCGRIQRMAMREKLDCTQPFHPCLNIQ